MLDFEEICIIYFLFVYAFPIAMSTNWLSRKGGSFLPYLAFFFGGGVVFNFSLGHT